MPQGLQVWDATGTMLIDTSTFNLRELVSVVITPVDTSTHYVTTAVPSSATIIANAAADVTNTNTGDIPTVQTDLANNRISYKFEATSGVALKIQALAF